jgi:uncharacterized Tic20 family protein
MTKARARASVLAATIHALGFLLGFLPGLFLWYVSYDRSPWLSRHGLAAARFQSVMFFIYVGLVSLYDRCRITTGEISSLTKWSFSPFLQRPEAISIAALCALAFVAAWFTSLALSMRSAIAAARGKEPAYPVGSTGMCP